MNMTFTGRKVTIKDSFKELAEKRLKKLDKFFEDGADVSVVVTVEKKFQRVEITVRYHGFIYRTEHEAPLMEDALENAADHLIAQIVKNKSRLEKRGLRQLPDPVADENRDEEEEFSVVKTKKFAVKPMNVEEAILQMNQLNHAFFIFINETSGSMNVVYKRLDGNYALLEPEVL